MRRLLFFITALALATAACSSASSDDAAPPTIEPTTTLAPTTTTAPQRSAPEAGPGRLAILDEDGDVAVIDRDGGNRIVVTDDAGASSLYFQPTWSPDGERLAFSRATNADSVVRIHDVAAATSAQVATPNPAFYFSWAPASDRVAYLGNNTDGTGLAMAVVDTEGETIRTDEGAPYYFSWGDTGDMVVHIGSDLLEVVDAAGDEQPSNLGTPGSFRAPHWTDTGILYIERNEPRQRLVLAPEGGSPQVVAELGGGVSFVPSPLGDRVAVQSVELGDEGTFASYGRLIGQQAAPTVPPNRLMVLDVETLELERVDDQPALAYWWSPTGDRLLALFPHDVQSGLLEWRVWSDEGLSEPIVFVPRPELVRDVLPFFDQYATSISLWSPGGDAFAFAGAVAGEAGIHVVELDGDPAPEKIADGAWVVWGR